MQVDSHPKTKHEGEEGEKGAASEKGLFKKVKEEIYWLLATSYCPEIYDRFGQNYTLLEQKGIISSIIDEIIKFEKT